MSRPTPGTIAHCRDIPTVWADFGPNSGNISTVSELGDDTHRLIKSVETGDPFVLSGPFGRFDYTRGGDHQVWVAGGIGVTPFRCFLGAPVPEHIFVIFFYCYHGAAQAVYANELANTVPANVRLHLVDDTAGGVRLHYEQFQFR